MTVVVGGGAFYGGMKYQQSKVPQRNFQQAGVAGNGMGLRNVRSGNGAIGGFVNGDIISKDDKSITVKSNDGSSKIVFFSGTTKIMKSVDGSPGDLATGKQVSVNGTSNQDGSVTAQTIQLRQATSTP